MNFTSFNIVQAMQDKFGILPHGDMNPHDLTEEEYRFRIKAMFEELVEYVDASSSDLTFSGEIVSGFNEWVDGISFVGANLEDSFDALIDLTVFALGTASRQSFPFDEGFARVMTANMSKELGPNKDKARGAHNIDLVKPEGWESPVLHDLVYPKPDLGGRLLVLEGADGTGKSTFAKYLQDNYDAEVIHCSWTEEIEQQMDDYLLGRMNQVHQLLQDGKLVVLDRHFISDWIYSSIFRGGVNWKGIHLCCWYGLRNLGAMYVSFSMDPDEYEGHMTALMHESERDELYTNMAQLSEVNAFYNLMSHGDLSFIKEGMEIPKEQLCQYNLMETTPSEFMESTLLPKLLSEGEE